MHLYIIIGLSQIFKSWLCAGVALDFQMSGSLEARPYTIINMWTNELFLICCYKMGKYALLRARTLLALPLGKK